MSSSLSKSRNIRVHKFANPSETSSPEYIGGLPEELCVIEMKDNQLIEVDPSTHLRVIHTPGHLKDHCSFYLEEENHVFTGDCVLGHGAVAFEDLQEYLASLKKILKLRPNWLFPGHGGVIKYGVQTLEKYLEVRQKKDKQILKTMETKKIWTARLLSASMNPETLKYSSDFRNFSIRIVGLHLIKLHNEGKTYMLSKKSYEAKTGLKAYNPLTVLSAFDEEWALYGSSRL
ncbi:beta-lactamase-like protein [Sporodiniella umbellata]|nr:beta-lactamase-like protein [Sporodiniella umbellata]